LIAQVNATGEAWVGKSVSVMLHRAPGEAPEERYIDLVYQALHAADGSITGVFAHGIDITDRKRAEEALRQTADNAAQQARVFDTSLSAITDLVHTFDRKGRFLYANKALLTLIGRSANEVLGKSVFELGYPDELAIKLYRQIQHVFDTGERIVDETPFTSAAGVTGHFEYILTAVPGLDGRTEVVTGSTRDIIARTRAEQELRDAYQHKTDFLSMLAHELRNPLAPIRSAVQLMRLTDGMHKVSPSMPAMMERQIGQMARLIDDLLDVSRISRGKVELRLERAALAVIVQQAVEAAQPLYESLDQELTVTLPAKPICLLGDPARLSQAVGNLLNNASKFTDRGGRVQVSVTSLGGMAVVSVSDNGVGIPSDHLLRIFEMFTQLDSSLERSRGGLGIGLALVKDLIEMHGGTIEALSGGVGQGSEFVLRVPLLVEELAPLVPLPARPRASATLRILVVDDNLDAADSLAMLLRFSHYDVTTAYDGQHAIEAFADRHSMSCCSTSGSPGSMVMQWPDTSGRCPTAPTSC
jgi:PAS domain S-box-containing protein